MLATEYAEYYKITPQGEKESDSAFKSRVAGELRARGKLIEAHEAFNDARYENSADVMNGVTGAIALALSGINFHVDGEHQIGDDIAAGVIAQDDTPKMSAAEAMLAMMFFGKP